MKKTFKIITIFIFLSIYLSTSIVEAEKFNSSDGNIYAEFSLNKASYSPGETITAIGAFTINGFLDRDLLNVCSAVVVNGKDAAKCFTSGTNFFAVPIPTGSFTTPLTAGIYTADLNISFDYNSNHYAYSFPLFYGVVETVTPVVTVRATPSVVKKGESSLVEWTSTNATLCRLLGSGNAVIKDYGDVGTTDSYKTPNLDVSTTYTVDCKN